MVVNGHAEANDEHQQVTHILSIGHLNNGGLYSITLSLDIFALEIRAKCCNIDRTEFSVRRNQYSARLVHSTSKSLIFGQMKIPLKRSWGVGWENVAGKGPIPVRSEDVVSFFSDLSKFSSIHCVIIQMSVLN